jgi:hypothetical protein
MRRALRFILVFSRGCCDGRTKRGGERLDNPRGLDDRRHGFIDVAEGRRGRLGPCIIGGKGPQLCLGQTGASTLIALGAAFAGRTQWQPRRRLAA